MVANRTQTQKVKARFGLVTQTQKVVIKGKKTEIQYTIFQISNLNFPQKTKLVTLGSNPIPEARDRMASFVTRCLNLS